MDRLVLFLVFIGIAFAIAYFLGMKRQIGFGWSFFFCLFLSPIGGLIITMLSRKYYAPNPEPSFSKKVWGWILIVLFSLSGFGQLMNLGSEYGGASSINALFIAIGLIGLGFYLLELGKGRNFNSEELTKSEE